MPRAYLFLLALGVLVVIFASLGEDPRETPIERVLEDPPPTARDLGEPDLFMETAEISQFSRAGELAYLIRAVTIVHYPEAEHTLLEAPRLVLYRDAEPPWEASARSGRIIGGAGLLDVGPGHASAAAPGREIVELEDGVLIQRRRPGEGFMELHTERLTLFPGREYAETERPVIIDTHSGRTTAEGLRADLAAGTIALGSPTQRVRSTIFPGLL